MSKRKKPTNMELKTAISGIITELDDVKRAIMGIDKAVTGYIKYKNDYEGWVVWMEKQIAQARKEYNESRSAQSGDGSGTTGTRTAGKEAPVEQNQKTQAGNQQVKKSAKTSEKSS